MSRKDAKGCQGRMSRKDVKEGCKGRNRRIEERKQQRKMKEGRNAGSNKGRERKEGRYRKEGRNAPNIPGNCSKMPLKWTCGRETDEYSTSTGLGSPSFARVMSKNLAR
jgi:hypothetical protein